MKYVFSTTLALALLTSAPALAEDSIDVMTQNQYLGADLTPIIAADPTDPGAFNQAVIDALSEVAANDIATRADLLARLIANRLPELVGLQEVFRYECYDLAPPTPDEGCNDPRIANAFPVFEGLVQIAPGVFVPRSVNNHLDLTTEALSELGETYVPVARVANLRITDSFAPGLPPGIPVFLDDDPFPDITVTILDRDVILARDDVADYATPLSDVLDLPTLCPARDPTDPEAEDRTSLEGCNYQWVAPTPLDVVPFIERGWVGVDVVMPDRKAYRFVNTHLEVQEPEEGNPASSFFQAAQAAELIGILDATANTPSTRSLIVVGDINSSSEDPIIDLGENNVIIPPYTQFIGSDQFPGAGYTDAWTLTGDTPGFSCCQESDLSNISSIHDERIDVIFSLDPDDALNKVKKKRVLGSKVPDKSAPDGLWPSDHGSVAAELQFDE